MPTSHLLTVFFFLTLSISAANVTVPSGGDLQGAINNAQPGDTITLAAGAVYSGNFVLPTRSAASADIVIQSSNTALLPANTRVSPASAQYMAAIVTPNSGPAIAAADGANHFRFVGIEFRPAAGIYVFDMVLLGSGTTTFAALPHDFTLDRVYIHGDPTVGSKRGVTLNCSQAVVENSYISDFKSTAQDTQAIGGWNGPGPFSITNNYLEAAGENILFGDPGPSIQGLVPSDITVKGNYFFKPLSWRPGDPSYAGTPWSVKNLFELKSAQRVNVSGNVFENCWISAQTGFAIVFTVRTQDGANPTAVIKDVTFRGNLVRHAGHGVSILGVDANGLGQASNLTITENAFVDITGAVWASSPGRLFQIINDVQGLTIQRNIGLQDGPMVMADEAPTTGLVFRDNIVNGQTGFLGTGTASANSTLNAYFPGGLFTDNVVIGGNAAQNPSGNFFPASLSDVGFENPAAAVFHLPANSPYATTGVGVAVNSLEPAIAAAISGSVSSGIPPLHSSPTNATALRTSKGSTAKR
jgi:hypothetical protein